jgi:hypothetical protein
MATGIGVNRTTRVPKRAAHGDLSCVLEGRFELNNKGTRDSLLVTAKQNGETES